MNQMHRPLTILEIIFHYIPCMKTHCHSLLEALLLGSTDVLRNFELPDEQELELVILEIRHAIARP